MDKQTLDALTALRLEFHKQMFKIEDGGMTLRMISEGRLLRREYWTVFAGARYGKREH